jgi:ABC-type Fe3+-siderophore transport system permease subunit
MNNNKKRSDRQLPEEVIGLLSSIFFMPAIAAIGVLAAMLLPSITSFRGMDVTRLFWVGVATGISGVILLFLARLPLYRQRRFWTFGPRELDRFHRRLYWLAYLVVLASLGLLLIVWFKVR